MTENLTVRSDATFVKSCTSFEVLPCGGSQAATVRVSGMVGRAIVVQEQDPFGEIPSEFFRQSALQMHHKRREIIRVDNMALWKKINDPKNSRRELFQRISALRIIWGEVSRYAVTLLTAALPPSQSDITRFRP